MPTPHPRQEYPYPASTTRVEVLVFTSVERARLGGLWPRQNDISARLADGHMDGDYGDESPAAVEENSRDVMATRGSQPSKPSSLLTNNPARSPGPKPPAGDSSAGPAQRTGFRLACAGRAPDRRNEDSRKLPRSFHLQHRVAGTVLQREWVRWRSFATALGRPAR